MKENVLCNMSYLNFIRIIVKTVINIKQVHRMKQVIPIKDKWQTFLNNK